MHVRTNEQLAVHIHLMLTAVCVPLTLVTAWLCRTLPQPLALTITWLCCCLQMALLSLVVWLRTLRGLQWPCRQISIEAPLLIDRTYHVHHAQFPLSMSDVPRMTSGPSILFLSTCAMLTIPEKHRTSAQRAVMNFLAPLKLDQGGFIRKHKQLGTRTENGLDWLICQDSGHLQAYASGDAYAVLAACDYIWDGERKPLTDPIRRELLDTWTQEELPPMGFAMADQEGGQPVDAVFLGAMLMEHQVLPHARHEVDMLRRQHYRVSLQGVPAKAQLRLSDLLGCDAIADPDAPDVLTIACTDQAEGNNVYITASTVPPTRTVSYLKTMHRRLVYQPVQTSILLTNAALCCLIGGMGVYVLALVQVMLLAQCAFPPVAPRPLPRIRRNQAIIGAAVNTALTVGMCFALSWFLQLTVGSSSGACMLYLLPLAAHGGYLCARNPSALKPTLILLPVVLLSVGLAIMAFYAGATLISSLFALVAGLLCTIAANVLLQYADGR